MAKRVPFGKAMRKEFLFDDDYLNLNHGIAALPSIRPSSEQTNLIIPGSFGTYPKVIQTVLRKYQDAAEARPDEFIRYEYPKLLDESRAAIAKYLHAPVDTITYIPNATTGVNTVLRNLEWHPGDKIIYFATIYGGCGRTVAYITETTPADSVKISYTYPISDSFFVSALRDTVRKERAAGNNPRVCIFDTVSSMPGCRMPFEALTRACKELGVLSLIDGAHGAGHLPLDLAALDPDFFVSNCHKWLLVPRGCAVFYVPFRHQPLIRSTLPTSHGFLPRPRPGITYLYPFPPSGKSDYVTNFEFVGTVDTSPYLCVPEALRWREEVCGGEEEIIRYMVELNRKASERVAEMLGTEYMENKEGTLRECNVSNVKLPLKVEDVKSLLKEEQKFDGNAIRDWLTFRAMKEYGVFIAFIFYNDAWWVRLSAQIYLELADFEWAVGVLEIVCEDVRRGKFLEQEAKAKL